MGAMGGNAVPGGGPAAARGQAGLRCGRDGQARLYRRQHPGHARAGVGHPVLDARLFKGEQGVAAVGAARVKQGQGQRAFIKRAAVIGHDPFQIQPTPVRAGAMLLRRQDHIQFAVSKKGRKFRARVTIHLDFDPGMNHGEPFQRLGQKVRRVVFGRAEADHAAQLRPGEGGQGLVVQRQQPPRVAVERLAVRRQGDPAPLAQKQGPAEVFLQLLHLHAHGGLRPVRLRARLGETAEIGGGDKGAQQIGRELRQGCCIKHDYV